MGKKYILAIDSGSTGIRGIIFNQEGNIVAREYQSTPAEHPELGAIEHDPSKMFESLISVVKQVLNNSQITANEIVAAGITNQRSSFCLMSSFK